MHFDDASDDAMTHGDSDVSILVLIYGTRPENRNSFQIKLNHFNSQLQCARSLSMHSLQNNDSILQYRGAAYRNLEENFQLANDN